MIVESAVFHDQRGFFHEIFRDEHFTALGLAHRFRQDNHSRSLYGVLRGLHFQLNRPQGKLVTVISGEIFDVAVDIRLGSPTFGKWFGRTLRSTDPWSIWIPAGYAHGFCVVSDVADVVYKCTDVYVPDDERGVHWADAGIGIQWPTRTPIVSTRDERLPDLDSRRTDLPQYAPHA